MNKIYLLILKDIIEIQLIGLLFFTLYYIIPFLIIYFFGINYFFIFIYEFSILFIFIYISLKVIK